MKVACIPAYNEEKTIARVVIGCQRYVDKVIVCDDGSSDMTAEIADRLGAEVIKHDKNMGKGEALRTLFRTARKLGADIMITIDADAQHDPEEIPSLLEQLDAGTADIVIGSRFMTDKGRVPQHRTVVNKLFNTMTLDGISDTQSGFRAYDKEAIESIIPAEAGMGADSEILMDAAGHGLTIEEVSVSVRYGIGNTSKLNPAHHTLDVIFSIVKLVSIKHPLLFYGVPGFAFLGAGVYYLLKTIALLSVNPFITALTLTYALLSFALTLVGLLSLFTGVILFTISTVVRKGQD